MTALEQSETDRLSQRMAGQASDPGRAVISGFPIKRQDPLLGAPDDSTCAFCGSQIALCGGVLRKSMSPSDFSSAPIDGRPVPDAQKERDENGQISDRSKRGFFWGCGKCNAPVSLKHPRQVKTDAEWKARDAKEAALEQRRRDPKNVMPTPEHEQMNPNELLENEIDKANNRIAALEKERQGDRKQLQKQGEMLLTLQSELTKLKNSK